MDGGGFTIQSADQTGIRIYGEQRGAAVADYDHDGRPDLVVTQNGTQTMLYRNNSPTRGLRVQISGPRGNVDGIGSTLRVRKGGSWGPAREIHAGAGYWSQDSATTVLAIPEENLQNLELQLRWPGGRVRAIQVPKGSTEYSITYN